MKRAVTYTELKERRRCPWRAHLSYDRRLTPIIDRPGLREGAIMDAGWNALYEHVRETGKYSHSVMAQAMIAEYERQLAEIEARTTLMDEERQLFAESVEQLLDISYHYVSWARENNPRQEIITTQYAGRVPVVSPSGRSSTRYEFLFKLDGLVVIDGRLWIEERKAWKTIDTASLKLLQLDEQCGMYLWALREQFRRCETSREVEEAVRRYGLPVGVHYVIARKKVPAVPPQLKDGSTSRDKRIDTTYEVYLRTLEERGQDPADYVEILDTLRCKGNSFFHRELVLRNDRELEEIGRRIWQATRFLAEGHTYKLPDRTCNTCQYFALCVEHTEDLEAFGYYVRDRRHQEYEDVGEAA